MIGKQFIKGSRGIQTENVCTKTSKIGMPVASSPKTGVIMGFK